jgi:dipeptidase
MLGLAVAFAAFVSLRSSLACTTFAVGRKATADGSVMSTHSNDGGGTTDPRLVKIPAGDFAPGSMRPIYTSPENYPRYVGVERQASAYYPENCQAGSGHCDSFEPIGYIPQVNHTFAYFEATYGTMNEKQVSLTESTCSGVYAALAIGAGGRALLSIDQLGQIAMERASTAREAIQIMGSLSEVHGFYGESASFEGGSESLFVMDPTEVWAFHILADPTGTSSIWGAARVPDDSVAVVANMFSIREMDLSDPDNFMGRADMWDLAASEGLYTPGQPKDFTATFSDGEYAHKYYSGRRMWGVFRLLAPSANLSAEYGNLKTDAPYPFAVKVDTPVPPQGVMSVMRDWYNDTSYSTGEGSGVSGGAFASPDRYNNNNRDYAVAGNW